MVALSLRHVALAGLAVAALTFTFGCSDKAKAERDSLYTQNQQLQQQLDAEKAAREAAEKERDAMAGKVVVTPPPMTAPAPVPGPDKSDGDITRGKNKFGEDTLQISSDVLFDSGKAALKPAAKKTLDKVAAIIKKEYAGNKLRVEGHTDPNPVAKSGWDDNWDLGAARARAVLLYLESKGISRKSMYTASFADTELKSPTNYALDRRVEIVVVKGGK